MQDLVGSDPKVMMGKPTIRGTRVTVELVLEKLAAGETFEQILASTRPPSRGSPSTRRRTARTLLDRDPARAVEPMEYVLSLSEADLAEMRALIFELRPEALESDGLISALEKQAAALRARHGIEVRTSLIEGPDLPPETKEALYRIVQEALQNTVEHAGASNVELCVGDADGAITLDVSDDGAGFDLAGSFPGHLGLKSMRERAERLGGELEIGNAPGEGTRIRVRLSPRSRKAHASTRTVPAG